MNRRDIYNPNSYASSNQFDRGIRTNSQSIYQQIPPPMQQRQSPLQPPLIQQPQMPQNMQQPNIKQDPIPINSSSDISKPYPIESVFLPTQNPESDKEFDLANLGIDLLTTNPLLPSVYYVGSDAPMITQNQYPASIHFPQQVNGQPISSKIKQVNDFVLFFMFYVHARDQLQADAANELKARKYNYDKEKRVWVNTSNKYFDPHTWSFIDLSKWGTVPRFL